MKISEWFLQRVGSHDIVNSEAAAIDFKKETGYDAPWCSHTVKQTRAALKAHPAGGTLNVKDSKTRTSYGYEMAEDCARKFTENFDSWQTGRGFRYQTALGALQKAGL